MPQTYNGFTIPIYAESADAVLAFTNYTDSVVTSLAAKAPSTGIAQSAVTNLSSDLAAKTDLAMAKNAQTGTSYSYVLADQTKLLTMSNAAANTVLVTKQATVAWAADTQLRVLNIGAGATTLVADTGVTINNNTALAQWRGGVLIRMSSDVWTFVPFASGTPNLTSADVSSTTGSPTITTSGSDTIYKYTSSGTFVLSKSGFCTLRIVGAGGGGGKGGGGGGGGGAVVAPVGYLESGTYTITIPGGGAGAVTDYIAGAEALPTIVGKSPTIMLAPSGGGGGGFSGPATLGGASGGGGPNAATATPPTATGTVLGFTGGLGSSSAPGGGGGGGGAGAVGTNASAGVGGNGGAGAADSITGSSVLYGMGGGGGTDSGTGGTAPTNGGAGGGGVAGSNAAANFGGGGGGGGSAGNGGNGGSAVVIIKVVT